MKINIGKKNIINSINILIGDLFLYKFISTFTNKPNFYILLLYNYMYWYIFICCYHEL